MTLTTLQEFIDASMQAKSVEDVHALCSRLCQQLEFDYFAYWAKFPTSFVKPYLVIISGYPTEWYERYNSEGYMANDPTIKYCENHITPLIWEFIEFRAGQIKQVRKVMSEAADFGLRSGISVPVHGAHGEVALLSIVREDEPSRSRKLILASMPTIQVLSSYIHEAVRSVMSAEVIPIGQVQLTNRERECLLWAAEGKSSWEAAKILGISENTVIFHFKNASRKLNVSNRQQAVARAIAQGLITPQFL